MTSKSKVRGVVELFSKIRRTGVEATGRVGIAAKDTVDGVSSGVEDT